MRKPLKSLIFKSIIYFFIAVIGFLQPTLALVNPTPAYATTAQYQYDPMGQMTTDGETCYEYNDIHKLKAVKDCNTGELQEEYVYDFDGTRIIKKVYEHGTLTETIYQPTDSYETRVDTQTGETTNTIYYRVNGELVASKQTPEATPTATQTVYYHNDHLQSTSTLTDQQGNVLETTEYKPYGDTLGTTDTTGQALANSQSKYQFTGQEKDQTGLYYYGARYYDPNLKRFTSADSLLPDPYDPQQLNRYSYVRNNPVKYVDPSGNYLETALDIAFIGWDINDIYNDPTNWVGYAALTADVVGAILPVLTGGGVAVKALAHGDDIPKLAKVENVAVVKGVQTTIKAVQGNSKLSTKAQHGYEIFEKAIDDVVKTGVSSGKISKAGKSYRATSQVNLFNKLEGLQKYDSRIVKKIPSGSGARREIYKWEKWNTNRLFNDPTNSMRYHSLPLPNK